MLIGYSSIAQSGRYVVILYDGMCIDGAVYTWFANPKIIVIDPNGVITETNLNTATSMADVIAHEAAFNVVTSDIMNQGYTISLGGAASILPSSAGYGTILGFSDVGCPSGTTITLSLSIALIPCCAP